jgi:hypothetical protein
LFNFLILIKKKKKKKKKKRKEKKRRDYRKGRGGDTYPKGPISIQSKQGEAGAPITPDV